MYKKYHTKGIIISGQIEGDNDRRVSIFTEGFGLVKAKAQGARNVYSKLRGGSQDFSFGDFSLIHGRSGWRIVSVRAEKNFFEMFRNSPDRLKIVGNILNLIKRLVSEEEASTSLFKIVTIFFDFLDKAKESDVALAECLTLVRILHSLGYMGYDPELTIPLASSKIEIKDLETIAPRRAKIIQLINESLKAA